jgi:hypothetical protein
MRRVNAEVCEQCHQFVVGSPEDKAAFDHLVLRKRAPRIRFSLREGYGLGPNGTYEHFEQLRTYID